MTDKPDIGWAIVEVMGHNRYVGYCSEITVAGTAFLHVEIPERPDSPPFSKILGAGSIYAITPCTEAVARAQAPAREWELNRLDFASDWYEALRVGRKAIAQEGNDTKATS